MDVCQESLRFRKAGHVACLKEKSLRHGLLVLESFTNGAARGRSFDQAQTVLVSSISQYLGTEEIDWIPDGSKIACGRVPRLPPVSWADKFTTDTGGIAMSKFWTSALFLLLTPLFF
ncbi:MAG TPA: hypothetical protein VER98_06530, partial [Terriglobia bacterium]|nr:hypothetical protein [Terriglobia bacterium]